jgi:two-component system phosphate regulon response regulator OmpR
MLFIMTQKTAIQDKAFILVVDDDRRIRDLLSRYLRKNDFGVVTASDAMHARRLLELFIFDLLIVDVMMPGETGVSLTRAIREKNPLQSVLMLTALGEADDRISGLEAGADDYLTKPFEPRELLLRVKSILRRQPQDEKSEQTLQFGACHFDAHRDILECGQERIHLTLAESNLLKVLAAEKGKVWSRQALLAATGIEGNERTIDVQVTRLRRKIENDPKAPLYLQTVRGQGYVLKPD